MGLGPGFGLNNAFNWPNVILPLIQSNESETRTTAARPSGKYSRKRLAKDFETKCSGLDSSGVWVDNRTPIRI